MKREEILNTLDALYDKVLQGVPPKREGAVAMAERYLRKNDSVDEAALDLITDHISRCTATGFVLGLGGLVTMPLTIPANIAGVLYFQLRMIAGVAYMGGYDVYSPQVRMLTYVCLAGISIQSMLKNTGVKIGTRITKTVVAKIPAKLTATINRGVGYRLFTTLGSRGVWAASSAGVWTLWKPESLLSGPIICLFVEMWATPQDLRSMKCWTTRKCKALLR